MTNILAIRGVNVIPHVPKKNKAAYFRDLLYNYNTFLLPEEPNLFRDEDYNFFVEYIRGLRPDYCNVVMSNKRHAHNLLNEVCNVEYWENYCAYDVAYSHMSTKSPRINHLYLYLQGRGYDFRLQFNNLLNESNLISKGITNLYKRFELNYDCYAMQHDLHLYTPKKYFTPKNHYPFYSTFIHVVTANTIDFMSYDEKFYRSIFNYKPFLGIACKNWHKGVEDMGFLLPDFIDYSFDECDILEDRMRGIVKNLKRLSRLSIEEINELYMDYYHVWEHNYNRVWDMVKAREGIPDICLQHPHYVNLVTSVAKRQHK